jgi:hypothetical protein
MSRGSPSSVQAWIGLLPEHLRDRVKAPAERDGGDFEYEYRVCAPDGETRWFLCRGRMVLGDDGVPTRSLGVAVDISDRKRAEDEHSRLEEQLRQARRSCRRSAGSRAASRTTSTTSCWRSVGMPSWRKMASSAEATSPTSYRSSFWSPIAPPT